MPERSEDPASSRVVSDLGRVWGMRRNEDLGKKSRFRLTFWTDPSKEVGRLRVLNGHSTRSDRAPGRRCCWVGFDGSCRMGSPQSTLRGMVPHVTAAREKTSRHL